MSLGCIPFVWAVIRHAEARAAEPVDDPRHGGRVGAEVNVDVFCAFAGEPIAQERGF